MTKFIECIVLVKSTVGDNEITTKRKMLVKKRIITGIMELNNNKCKMIIERKDGTVEEYILDQKYEELKKKLNSKEARTP